MDPTHTQSSSEAQPSKTSSSRKRWRILKWVVLCLLLTPLVLSLLVPILLYIPAVQRQLVAKAELWAAKNLNIELHIGDLHIGFPLKLHLEDVQAVSAEGDTLLLLGELQTVVPVLPLLNGQIELPQLALQGAKFFIPDSLRTTTIQGEAELLFAGPVAISLSQERVDVGTIQLKQGGFGLYSIDTVREEEEKPVKWLLQAQQIELDDAWVDITMPHDSLFVKADIERGQVSGFELDLETMLLCGDKVELDARSASYRRDSLSAPTPYVNYTNLVGKDLHLRATDFRQQGAYLEAEIGAISMREQSGARVNDFHGYFMMQDGNITVQHFSVTTPKSRAHGDIYLPLSFFIGDSIALLQADLQGSLHADDIYYFTTFNLAEIGQENPLLTSQNYELVLKANVSHQKINVQKLQLSRPNLLFLRAKGTIQTPFSSIKRRGKVTFEGEFEPAVESVVVLFAPSLNQKVAIPPNTKIGGNVNFNGKEIQGDFALSSLGQGAVSINAKYTLGGTQYFADIQSQDFNMAAFLPADSLGIVDMRLKVDGRGFDILSGKAHASIESHVGRFDYKGNSYRNFALAAALNGETFDLETSSATKGLDFALQMRGAITNRTITGELAGLIDTLDLGHIMGQSDTLRIRAALQGHFKSNLKEYHTLQLSVHDLFCHMGSQRLTVDSMQLSALTCSDSIEARLGSKDLNLHAFIGDGLSGFLRRIDGIQPILSNMAKLDTLVSAPLDRLIAFLPPTHFSLQIGANHPLSHFLSLHHIAFSEGNIGLSGDSVSGIRLAANLNQLVLDTTKINHIGLEVNTRSADLRSSLQSLALSSIWNSEEGISNFYVPSGEYILDMRLNVEKSRFRHQMPFSAQLAAQTDLNAIELSGSYIESSRPIHQMAAIAFRNGSGLGLSFKPSSIIIQGQQFTPNSDNAVYYSFENKSIRAALLLEGKDGAEIELKSSQDELRPQINRINLLVRNLQLSNLNDLFGIDELYGRVFADLILERDPNTLIPSAVGDISINDFSYQGEDVGHASLAIFYEPRDNSSHYINAEISHNGDLVMVTQGRYLQQDKKSPIKASVELETFPLAMINPFLGAELATLEGMLQGKLQASGTTNDIRLNGELFPQGATIFLPQIGDRFVLMTNILRIVDNKLKIDNLRLKPEDKHNYVAVMGDVTLFGPKGMTVDLGIRGDEVELIDSKASKGQMLYGRLISSLDLSVRGQVARPKIRGAVDIIGGTNVTYVYTTARVKAADNLDGVVLFTDFSDTLACKSEDETFSRLGGMDIALNIHIDPAVEIGIDLSPRGADYVRVIGGGDLRFEAPAFGQMSLTGRYNLSGGGSVKYNFPVVGRKEFTIDRASFITWSGAIMNPFIDFKATQRVRAEVVEGNDSRKVNFDVYIVAKDHLENIDLAFDLQAPEDLSIQNKISTMSQEERGKQAVGLMVSGSFLASDPSQLSMQKIFSSLAVGELNNLTGKFLEGTDFNVGMELHDGSTTGTGNTYTDYTYSFSRRFYNDRLRFVIGGRVGAGNLPTNYEQTFVDNVTLEYRLDQAGSRYVKLFHKRNNDNLLEGIVTETGASYLMRRKLWSLKDLFLFRSSSRLPLSLDSAGGTLTPPTSETDSITQGHVTQ